MDPIEKRAGIAEDNFWHRAKLGLIGSLLDMAGTKGKNILVIGCGTGNDLEVIGKYSRRLIVSDINRNALKSIKGRFKKIHSDATQLPLKDSSVDIILSLDVFEHIKDDEMAIVECRRVLKKGGKLIFTVPAWSRLYSGFDRKVLHFRRYDKKDMERKLSGYRRIYLGYWNFLLFPLFATERLVRKGSEPIEKTRCKRTAERPDPKTTDLEDALRLPRFANQLLYRVLSLDNLLVAKGVRLPFGLSLCGIYQKI